MSRWLNRVPTISNQDQFFNSNKGGIQVEEVKIQIYLKIGDEGIFDILWFSLDFDSIFVEKIFKIFCELDLKTKHTGGRKIGQGSV